MNLHSEFNLNQEIVCVWFDKSTKTLEYNYGKVINLSFNNKNSNPEIALIDIELENGKIIKDIDLAEEALQKENFSIGYDLKDALSFFKLVINKSKEAKEKALYEFAETKDIQKKDLDFYWTD